MEIIHYEPEKKASIIAEALTVLLSGGTIIYPTETSYALGADFFSPGACRRIYKMKFRDETKPLPVLVPDVTYAHTLVKFSRISERLASEHWPGPLTLVLPFLYKKHWSHHGSDFLALRVSSHPFAFTLAKAFGGPLVSTSANISGVEPGYNVESVMNQLQESFMKPDLVINAGTLKSTPPSTIVKDENGRLTVLRKGPISIDDIP